MRAFFLPAVTGKLPIQGAILGVLARHEYSQSSRRKGFLVREIDPEVMVFDAVLLMDAYQVGALMVVKDDLLVGLISERDYPARLC